MRLILNMPAMKGSMFEIPGVGGVRNGDTFEVDDETGKKMLESPQFEEAPEPKKGSEK